MAFGFGFGSTVKRSGGVAAGGALSITTAPTIAGDPVVGQRLYATNGTYSATPDSYTGQWYKDGSAISGETADNYRVQDADVGSVFAYGEIGVKAGYSNSPLNMSSNTAAVTDIDLSNAITAFTRTSSSGVTPMTFSVTFGSNVYSGYQLRARVYSDSGLSTLLQDVVHTLTAADLAGGAIDFASDGLTAIGATQWLQLSVQTTSPNGVFHDYTFGTARSPTDAVSAMTWSTTDKNTNISVTGTGNLTASGGGGQRGQGIRGSRPIGPDFSYWETTMTSVGGGAAPGVANGSVTLSSQWSSGPPTGEGVNTTDAAAWFSNLGIFFNGSLISSAGLADGDIVGIAVRKSLNKMWWQKTSGGWLPSGDPAAGTGGLDITAMLTGPIYPALNFSFGGSMTGNFGTSAFAYTPPAGSSAP